MPFMASKRNSKRKSSSPLAHSELAQQVSLVELDALDHIATVVDLEAGSKVIRQGRLGRQCLVVIDGRLSVERDGAQVADLGPGQFAGEISLLSRRPCNADVVANEGSRAYVLSPREFSSLMDGNPGIRWHVLTTAIERITSAA